MSVDTSKYERYFPISHETGKRRRPLAHHSVRRHCYPLNWHFGGDGARHGLKVVSPVGTSGTRWFWNYTRKRWDVYTLGGIDANLVVASVR